MSNKYFDPFYMYELPSGQLVHPSRLIHRDGCIMWKHALLHEGAVYMPETTTLKRRLFTQPNGWKNSTPGGPYGATLKDSPSTTGTTLLIVILMAMLSCLASSTR